MEKSLFILSFNTMPRGFLLCLALIITFELFLSFIPEYKFLTPPYEQAALAMKGEIVDKPNSFDIIVLGDCTGWAAIKPFEFEKQLNKAAFNFATNGAQTYLMSYVLLKRYLTNCTRKPELVMLQLSANAFFYIWGMNSDALKYHILPWFRMDDDFLQELSAPMQQICHRYKVLQLIPSLKKQFFLRKGLWPLKLWKANINDFERYINYYRKEKGFINKDYDPTTQHIEKITDIGEHLKQFSISEFNMIYIEKILKELLRHGIRTVVCLTPVRDDEMRIWEKYNLRSRLNSKINELIRPYPNIVSFLDMQSVASDPKYFIDWYHMNGNGASIYTSELLKKIKDLACSFHEN